MSGLLLRWYDRGRRDLPWRRQPDPYRTLVSELMLQQTVVAVVVPYFERFVARFPDLRALAAASEDEVLALWSGLGYYARARNLHRAAVAVVERHGGLIPEDEASLRGLPGIGAYTAAAVAAIAFGHRTFALDGNAARVVARLAAVGEPIDRPATRNRLRDLGRRWVPARRAGDFAQAVMELGATICAPRRPACGDCPVSVACESHRAGTTTSIPTKTSRPARQVIQLASVRVRRAGRVLLVRPRTGLLGGTWMLPAQVIETSDQPGPTRGAGGTAGREVAQAERARAVRAARAAVHQVGLVAVRIEAVGTIRHLFTHRDVTVEVFDASVKAQRTRGARAAVRASGHAVGGDAAAGSPRWVEEAKLDELAVSSFLRKQLALKRDKVRESP